MPDGTNRRSAKGWEGLMGALIIQQGEGRHAVIGEAGLAIGQQQQLIAAQELQKQQGADAFVAIGEGVILDHKIEQVGSLQLGCVCSGWPSKVSSMAPRMPESA